LVSRSKTPAQGVEGDRRDFHGQHVRLSRGARACGRNGFVTQPSPKRHPARALSDTGGAPSPADLKAVYQSVLGKDETPDAADSAFQYGVASGDPDAESVVLWTHASPDGDGMDGPVSVYWEVATDAGFETVVDRGLGVTGPDEDHTFKVIADGLAPGGAYFYRFRVDGEWSETGKTRTLPEGDIDSVTFAVFSCVNYPAGFFNAYDAAVENGFDYSIHLGDYIYEYGPGGYATDLAEALDRVPAPANELITLDDYLARYAQYTSDEDLQALRAEAPMIMMWDDHETANDSWETGAENHNDGEGDWFARRDAGLEAYFRWNPLREPEPDDTGVVDLRDHDKTYEFGDLVDLHMLETRLQAREETRADILTAITDRTAAYQDPTSTQLFEDAAVAGVPQAAILQTLGSGDAVAIQTLFTGIALAGLVAEARDPGREMIGAEQLDDLVGKIEASDATWQMIGSQTLMADMALPVEVLVGFEALSEVFVRAALGLTTPQDQALLSQLDAIPSEQKVPYNFDAWDGYQAEREVILDALAASGSGGIVIAGDTHNAWTSNLRTADGTLAAVEFGGPGVTSPGFEQLVPEVLDPVTGEPIDYAADVFLRYVDDLVFANLQDRGYMDVEVTRDEVRTDYVFVSTTGSRAYDTETVTQIAAIDDFHIV
jgi:phosphodiesterase/alkaline phosphatase D-like protein